MGDVTPALHAWADESMRTSEHEGAAYLLGAVIADPSFCAPYRERLRRLHRSEHKLHWRNLDRGSRDRVVREIASFDMVHLVVVGRPLDYRKQERARALCLERLTWELSQRDVSQLILEARTNSLMTRDLRNISALRSRGAIPRSLHIAHGLPSEEPMLWIADQVLGALGAEMAENGRWFPALRASVNIIRIDL